MSFKFGDQVNYRGKKALYVRKCSTGDHFICLDEGEDCMMAPSDGLNAGWLPQVFEDGSAICYPQDDVPRSSYINVPNSFKGKQVKVRIEETFGCVYISATK